MEINSSHSSREFVFDVYQITYIASVIIAFLQHCQHHFAFQLKCSLFLHCEGTVHWQRLPAMNLIRHNELCSLHRQHDHLICCNLNQSLPLVQNSSFLTSYWIRYVYMLTDSSPQREKQFCNSLTRFSQSVQNYDLQLMKTAYFTGYFNHQK